MPPKKRNESVKSSSGGSQISSGNSEKVAGSSASRSKSSSAPKGLGFDPAESSDLTAPTEVNLSERPELIQWQYLEGGDRLPLFFDKVPHLHDREPSAKKLVVSMETLELCQRIAREAKQAQLESVSLKQKADTLQAEKELLEWHIASNSKSRQIQNGIIRSAQKKSAEKQEKVKETRVEADAAELLNAALVMEVEKMEKDFAAAQKNLEAEENTFNEMASRKHNYLADIALERRIADHERTLRYHQWQKLARAANIDKKHHIKYDLGSNLDYLVFDAYQQVANFKKLDIAACDDVTGRARLAFNDQVEDVDPLDDFAAPVEDSGQSKSGGPSNSNPTATSD